jgi:membrane-associated phospholipid phosphatase
MASRPSRRSTRRQTCRTAAAGTLARAILLMPTKMRLVCAVAALASACVLVAAAWLSAPASAAVYSAVAPRTAGVRGVQVLADVAIVVLMVGYLTVLWWSRRTVTSLALGLAAGGGVVAAYLASESAKLLFRQDRPCRAVISLDGCPAGGDWSFPSNHMAIASGLALAMLMVSRRTWRLGATLVVAVAVGRVGQGAHYPHDVLAGLGVGLGWVAGVGVAGTPVTGRLLRRSHRRWGLPGDGGHGAA